MKCAELSSSSFFGIFTLRYTNLGRLFSHAFLKEATTLSIDNHLRQFVENNVDKNCTQSCLVFVNGIFSAELSSTLQIPADVIVDSIHSIGSHIESKASNEESTSASPSTQVEALKTIRNLLTYTPEIAELPRNSYGSEILTSLNSVSKNR